MQLEQFDAAHICYLMCGCPIGTNYNLPTRLLLLGCDHDVPMHSELMTPESIESFLCTEAFEWARRKGNKRTCLQSLQTFKLRYAELLADFGYVNLAREYVVSIRQLTGIGLDENANQLPPVSGNALVPVFPEEFVDRLYRFEDRLCVLTGAELSCKRKASEEHCKSALAAITGGLGSVFSRKPSEGKDSSKQDPRKLDEPSSENEFMDMIETKPIDKPVDKKNDQVKSRTDPAPMGSTTSAVESKAKAPTSPKPSEDTPKQFTPFNVPKASEAHKQDGPSFNSVPTGDFPPASAPPTLGDDAILDKVDHKSKAAKEKVPSPTSTPSTKNADKKAPSSEPPSKYCRL